MKKNYKTKTGKYLRQEPYADELFLGGLLKGAWGGLKGLGKGVGAGLGALSDVAGAVAPYASFIPGLGPIASGALGAAGGIGDFFQGGAQGGVGGFLGNTLGGAASGALGGIGGVVGAAGNLSGLFGGGRGAMAAPQMSGMMSSPGFMGGGGYGGMMMPQMRMMGQNPMMGMMGGYGANPLTMMSGLMGLMGGGSFQSGGGVPGYQKGGLVDIQAERGELIWHPTGALTDVHARRSHSKMDRSGDGDIITDHPLQDSFIFSDYLNIHKDDAEDLIIGVKRYPYVEGEKGREPEVFTIGDLFPRRGGDRTPAQLARRISKQFSVTNDKEDIFNILGDKLNMENRVPYLQGISMLSEFERLKDDIRDGLYELEDRLDFKKGGRVKNKKKKKYKIGNKYQVGTPLNPLDWNSIVGGLSNDPLGSFSGPNVTITPYSAGQPISPLPTLPIGGINNPISPSQYDYLGAAGYSGPNVDNFSISRPVYDMPTIDSGANRIQRQSPDTTDGVNGVDALSLGGVGSFNQNNRMMNMGSSMMPIGGAITTGSNVLGALGSYIMNNNFINENRDFYENQRNLANQSRNIASMGNIADMGMIGMQQAPEDLPTMRASRLKQFDPNRMVNDQIRLADQSLGDIRSLTRRNPNIRGAALGSAIAGNNANIASARQSATQMQYNLDTFLDQNDFNNANIMAQNQQRRTDFGNNMMQDMRSPMQAMFTNEASRPIDMAGLGRAERQADIMFRQNRLFQPINFLGSAGNSLSNLGGVMYGLGSSLYR